MLRDRFDNNRKRPPAQPASRSPAPAGNRFANIPGADTAEPSASGTAQPSAARAQSHSAYEEADGATAVAPRTAAYADELKKRWEASFSKSAASAHDAPARAAQMEGVFQPGQTINGIYKIEAPLSKGGMGCVYRAVHLHKAAPVVLKVMLHDRTPEDPAFIKFVQECKIAMTIDHPNVVTVYDWGILPVTLAPYLVMEHLSGQSMREVLRTVRKVPVHEAASLLAQACIGLDQIHREDVIHRDLKPENIMVVWEDDGTADGCMKVKILDFGIAQLHEGVDFTDGGRVLGTLSYMSPEQVEKKPLDLRSDIYSMGVLFYELVTGRVPFRGNSVWQTMSMHVNETHIPASQLVELANPQAVDAVIAACLAKNRQARYSSALELGSDLLALAEAEPR